MPPPCASLPRGDPRGWRECASSNNTTGQCKHEQGKPTMRLDPEAVCSAAALDPGAAHTISQQCRPHVRVR